MFAVFMMDDALDLWRSLIHIHAVEVSGSWTLHLGLL